MHDAVALTKTLIQLNTINPPGNERASAALIGDLLESAGYDVDYYEFQENRTSLVARISSGQNRKPICFTGHIDTVPLGAAKWTVDPFAGDIVDDKIFGRGATDMKSGLAAMVCAATAVVHELDDLADIVLVITAGEETGCHGARHLSSTAGALGEAGPIIVGEPTSNYPLMGHKGALWLEVTASGTTAHGSSPERGVNAIYRGARIVNKLEQYCLAGNDHAVFGSSTINVGTISGGQNINSVPDRVHIGVDIRTIPGTEHDALRTDLLEHLAPEVDSILPIADLTPVWTNPDSEWAQHVFSIWSRYHAAQPEARTVAYFTDACVLQPAYGSRDVIILGPGEPELAHQTDEYCLIRRIEEAVQIYKDIMLDWCNRSYLPAEAQVLSLSQGEP